MYQNFISVKLQLFRIIKGSNPKLLKFIGSMSRRKIKNKWRESISRRNLSRKGHIFNPQSRVSKKNSRKASSYTKLIISES